MAASPSADVQKAVELLDRLADDSPPVDEQSGRFACRRVDCREAVKSQTQAVETIDQIFMAVAPYANLVQRGIDRQEELIDQSPAAEKQEKSDEQNASANQTPPPRSAATFDGNEAAWNQRFIARYGRILSAKARRELEQLEARCRPPSRSRRSNPRLLQRPSRDKCHAASPDKDQHGSDEHLKADKQRRDLKEALQMGVQSAPKVEKLADEAALLLEEDKPGEALPKQQEALKLLKEMLPKQQQQEKDKKDQEKKDQEKKDQDKKIKIRKIKIKRTKRKKIKIRKISKKRIKTKQDQKKKISKTKISKKNKNSNNSNRNNAI